MPSDFSTVRNLFPSLQGLVSSPLKTLVSNPISAAKQKITAAQKPIKEKLRFFKSSTEDFPNLTGKLKNKIREYLEANRFYK
jgi:predicted translin family RNA/ssDNA-binding protein